MSNSDKTKLGYNPGMGDGGYDPEAIRIMKETGNANALGEVLKICSHGGHAGCTKDCDHNKPHRYSESCKQNYCRFVNSNVAKCVNVDTLGDVPKDSQIQLSRPKSFRKMTDKCKCGNNLREVFFERDMSRYGMGNIPVRYLFCDICKTFTGDKGEIRELISGNDGNMKSNYAGDEIQSQSFLGRFSALFYNKKFAEAWAKEMNGRYKDDSWVVMRVKFKDLTYGGISKQVGFWGVCTKSRYS